MNKKPTFSIHDEALLEGLLHAIEPFMQLNQRLPLRCVQAFLLIGFDEGHPVIWYADKLNVRPNTMSRNLLDIGPRNRYMADGYGLIISKGNRDDLRKREYFLSSKGKKLLDTVLNQLRFKAAE